VAHVHAQPFVYERFDPAVHGDNAAVPVDPRGRSPGISGFAGRWSSNRAVAN